MEICDKSKCVGCGLCEAICPAKAIELNTDKQGFSYPCIDDSKCVNCGLCQKKCIANGYKKNDEIKKVYAATMKDTDALDEVSSGGVCFAIMKAFVEAGGTVYGAVADNCLSVVHRRAESLEQILPMRRSKYLQSNMSAIYELLKKDIADGRKVLFTGTPCQTAAVKSFMGDADNLYTAEIICHGVPSAIVFKKYIEELEKKHNSSVIEIIFRFKKYGWGKNHYAIRFDNGEVLEEESVNNDFHSLYLEGVISRESCGQCEFSHLPRTADIILADYWKYNGELTEVSKGKGISLVVTGSDKGEMLLKQALNQLVIEDSTIEAAKESCRHLNNTPRVSRYRKCFMKDIESKGFYDTKNRYIIGRNTPVNVVKKILRDIRVHENK